MSTRRFRTNELQAPQREIPEISQPYPEMTNDAACIAAIPSTCYGNTWRSEVSVHLLVLNTQ